MKKNIKYYYIFILFTLAISCQNGIKQQSEQRIITNDEELYSHIKSAGIDTLSITYLLPIWNYYTKANENDKLTSFVKPTFNYSKKANDSTLLIYSSSYLAQAYLFQENYDSLSLYLNELSMLNLAKYNGVESLVNNIHGIYLLKAELNYTEAIKHFEKAYEQLPETRRHDNQITLLFNIVNLYQSRNDKKGIEYAKRALEVHKSGKCLPKAEPLTYIAMAEMYLISKNTDSSYYYVNKADSCLKSTNYGNLISKTKMIMADIYSSKMDFTRAIEHYKLGLEFSDNLEPELITNILLNYGKTLCLLKKQEKAIIQFAEGIEISYKYKNIKFRGELLQAISEAYYKIGDNKNAVNYYRKHHFHNDSIKNLQREREFTSHIFLQQRNQYDKQLSIKEIEILTVTKRNQLYLFILVIIIVIILFLILLFTKKKKLHSKLIKQYQYYMHRFDSNSVATDTIKLIDEMQNKQSNHELNIEAKKVLFLRLERIMSEDKIYRHKDISLDKIAEILNTNRSYLSKAINIYAKISLFHYINMYRIKDATLILAKPTEIPIKQLADDLGYNSLTSFYRAFQRETGCSPSRYRAEMIRQSK